MLKRLLEYLNHPVQRNKVTVPKQNYQPDAGTFRRLFKKHFTPFLRDNNWKGSGFRFYKETDNETIYLFEIFPEGRGGGYSVGLAVHYTFIPYRYADKVENYRCIGLDVRGGLPFESEGGGLLKYPTSDKDITENFSFLKEQLISAEASFFKKYGNWQEYYLQFKPGMIDQRESELKRITNSRFSLLCAKIFNHLNMKDRSKEMAEFGLTTINYPTGNGSALYPEFMEIVKAASKT